MNRIAARTGTAFTLLKGQALKVICPMGEQVADMVTYNMADHREFLSNGKTIDYAESIKLTTGNWLYSNKSMEMLKIIEDTCGIHDFLLSPCCPMTMEMFYDITEQVPTCLGNLHLALKKYGIEQWQIPTAFNIFMNVPVALNGKIKVLPPTAIPGDHIIFKAHMDLLIGLTACSASASNNGSYKPIDYEIIAS